MKSSAKKVELASVDDLFSTEESRADAGREKVVEIPLSELHSFKGHPFKIKVDTLNKPAMDITPFRNIPNEMYSADVLVKIKSAYRARFQQGKFMGTYAPYGYIKNPADHNHLLIDDKVAHVVREIFQLALEGNGISKIRKHINKQHILRPAAYAAEQGAAGYERYFEGNEENRYIWSENRVRAALRAFLQALSSVRTAATLFGLCAQTGGNVPTSSTAYNDGRYSNVMCTTHAIEARDLFNAVLADINRFADMAVNDERSVRAIEKRLTETDQSKAKAMEKERKKLNKRLAELARLFSSLYEGKVMERITERNLR